MFVFMKQLIVTPQCDGNAVVLNIDCMQVLQNVTPVCVGNVSKNVCTACKSMIMNGNRQISNTEITISIPTNIYIQLNTMCVEFKRI